MESAEGVPSSHTRNLEAVQQTLADAGVVFIDGGKNALVGVALIGRENK